MKAGDALRHSISKVVTSDLSFDPYTHLIVDNIFPDEFYTDMLDHFPSSDNMVHPYNEHRVYENVHQLDLVPDPGVEGAKDGSWSIDENLSNVKKYTFWSEFRDAYFGKEFIAALMDRFSNYLKPDGSTYAVGRLAIDYETAGLGPHIDRRDKLVSVLFYMPDVDDPALYEPCGTQLLRPKDPDADLDDRHYGWDQFEHVKTATFVPNRMVAWPVTDTSFHAYRQSADVSRQTIKYFVQSQDVLDEARERIAATADSSQDWRSEE